MVIDQENQSDPTKKPGVLGDHIHGELWIKLKLPKDEQQESIEEDQKNHQLSTTDHNNNTARICHVCNKGFRSGKALGGHMRIHFQAHKELICNKRLKSSQPIKFKKRKREEITLAEIAKQINISKSNATATTTNGNGTAALPTCSICSKTFPSLKSLFGHMRCHPDRDWRGIQPPPVVKTSSSSLVSDVEPQDGSDDQVNSNSAVPHQVPVDLTKSLLGWSATAKRGRKKTIFDREFLDAAHELMRLAHGGLFESGPTDNNKQRIVEDEATNSNSLTYKAQEEKLSAGSLKGHSIKLLSFPNDRKFEGLDKATYETGFLTGKSVNSQWEEDAGNWPKEYEDDDCTEDESDSKNTELQLNHKTCKSSSTNGKAIMFKKNKKRKKIKDLDSVHDAATPVHQVMTATPDKYRCSSCHKSFPTHQALGGHRSSHNKIRMTIHNSIDGWTSAADDDENLANSHILEDEEIKENEGAASSKQLDQPLGGQKNCHSSGAIDAPSSQVTSLGELSHTCGGRVLEFDLNETPPMEDDAVNFQSQHVAVACGHASSSFNTVEFFSSVFESSSSGL